MRQTGGRWPDISRMAPEALAFQAANPGLLSFHRMMAHRWAMRRLIWQWCYNVNGCLLLFMSATHNACIARTGILSPQEELVLQA